MGCYESKVPYRPAAALDSYLSKTGAAKVRCKLLSKTVPAKGFIELGDFLVISGKLKIRLPWSFFTRNSRVRAREVLFTLCIMSNDAPEAKLKVLKVIADRRSLVEYLELYYRLKYCSIPFWSVCNLYLSSHVAKSYVHSHRADSGVFVEKYTEEVGNDLTQLEKLGLLQLPSTEEALETQA